MQQIGVGGDCGGTGKSKRKEHGFHGTPGSKDARMLAPGGRQPLPLFSVAAAAV
jgi:hypothetical protein